MKLYQISQIMSGINFRKAINDEITGEVAVIQINDLISGLDFKETYYVHNEAINNKKLLQKNDILLIARGEDNRAFIYEDEKLAVVTSQIFVIRVDPQYVNPHFLVEELNKSYVQKFLKANSAGSLVNIITKSILEQLELDIPDVNGQNEYIAVKKLLDEEKRLKTAILENEYILNIEQLKQGLKNVK